MILAYCNQKGGVGKSTTVYHHARAAILDGQRVLVIDADPQGNITSVLTEDMQEGDVGVADALSSRSEDTLADVLVPGIWEGLTVAPTVGDNLADVRNELVISSEPGRESRLRAQLAVIQAEYDLVLIDCGPAIDPLTISALTAAEAVVIVSQSKLWSVNGLAKLMTTVGQVREHYNPQLTVAGLVLNAHEAHTLAGGYWADELTAAAEAAQLPILTPPVPKRQAIADATETARGLDEGDAQARDLAAIYAAHIDQLMKGTAHV